MPSKKPTQVELSEQYQCSPITIKRAKKDGVDIYDRDAFAGWVKTKAKRPHAWINGVPWEQDDADSDDGVEIKLSEEDHKMIEEIRNAPNYDVARTLKVKADAIMQVKKIKILEKQYIHVDVVENDLTRIGAGVLAAMKQMQADLPAMLEGLTAAESKKKIDEYTMQIAAQLSDELSKLYK